MSESVPGYRVESLSRYRNKMPITGGVLPIWDIRGCAAYIGGFLEA